jgi:hypothetical protein
MVRGEETFMVHVIDKRKTKMRESARTEDKKGQAQPAQPHQKGTPTASTTQKAPVAKELLPTPKAPPVRPPPRSGSESIILDFFDRPK